NLSHEETRRLSTAGFVSSRGMSYEIRDCSNGSPRRLTNVEDGKPAGVNRRTFDRQDAFARAEKPQYRAATGPPNL
ncbi:MAG: hypothetical protein ACXW4O_05925, partial [Candidatus Binatia bacterium]